MSEKLQNSQNSTGGGNTEGGSTDRYIRVRTDYYKIVEKPMTDGSIAQLLIKWKYGTIKADHGREYAEEVPCYATSSSFPTMSIPSRWWTADSGTSIIRCGSSRSRASFPTSTGSWSTSSGNRRCWATTTCSSSTSSHSRNCPSSYSSRGSVTRASRPSCTSFICGSVTM